MHSHLFRCRSLRSFGIHSANSPCLTSICIFIHTIPRYVEQYIDKIDDRILHGIICQY